MRLSGLQRDVLSLYRRCLREVRKKPAVCCRTREELQNIAHRDCVQGVRTNFTKFTR